MKKEENKETNEVYTFSKIVTNIKKGNWEEASNIYNSSDFICSDLIHLNEDAKTEYLAYYDEDQEKFDICPFLDNTNHIALLIEYSNKLKDV